MSVIISQRHLFDIPNHIAYFNCAYYSPLLNESRNRLITGAAAKSHPWNRSASDFFEDAETLRSLSAQLFGGDSDGYAIIPSASYGFSTAARIIEPILNPDDEILLTAEEFPSSVLPWKRIAQERGARISTAQLNKSGIWSESIISAINDKTKVVSLSTCHWTNAAVIDLELIKEKCNQTNCILLVDATQSLGAVPFSVDELQPDFLVASGYKWLLSPYGFSLMYVAKKWRDSRPLEETWMAREKAEDFSSLVNYSDCYLPGARRFDVGEKCTPTILPGAIAALEQLKAWGIQNISDSLVSINKIIADHLLKLGFMLPEESKRSPHMFGAIIPKHYNGSLVQQLREKNIYVSQRGNSIRFAPHLFINENDIHQLLSSLDNLMK